jgi:hypothetical protein
LEYSGNGRPPERCEQCRTQRKRDEARKRKARHRVLLGMIKRQRGCTDCGTRDGRLEFDHRPGEIKLFNPAHGVNASWQVLKAEIAKCDVRCSMCHRRRHIALRRENGTAPWMHREAA